MSVIINTKLPISKTQFWIRFSLQHREIMGHNNYKIFDLKKGKSGLSL